MAAIEVREYYTDSWCNQLKHRLVQRFLLRETTNLPHLRLSFSNGLPTTPELPCAPIIWKWLFVTENADKRLERLRLPFRSRSFAFKLNYYPSPAEIAVPTDLVSSLSLPSNYRTGMRCGSRLTPSWEAFWRSPQCQEIASQYHQTHN